MRVIIQRVSSASVTIDSKVYRKINAGFLVLVGFTQDDAQDDINWLVQKIINLRVFPDQNGQMNQSITDVQGDILLISQFTLYASTKKGNRPSFIHAAKPDLAIHLYKQTVHTFNQIMPTNIKSGKFGADMKISLVNDGPVTISIDSKRKE